MTESEEDILGSLADQAKAFCATKLMSKALYVNEGVSLLPMETSTPCQSCHSQDCHEIADMAVSGRSDKLSSQAQSLHSPRWTRMQAGDCTIDYAVLRLGEGLSFMTWKSAHTLLFMSELWAYLFTLMRQTELPGLRKQNWQQIPNPSATGFEALSQLLQKIKQNTGCEALEA